MASYGLTVKPSTRKEIEAVGTKADRQRIVGNIQALASDLRPSGSETFAGFDGRYRIGQGNCRTVYFMDEASIVTICKIGHRGDVYR